MVNNLWNIILILLLISLVLLYIHDRYVQRKHQLLINYPIIGRFRYFFEALREPLRQYFAEETFYDSRDKINWVYKAAKDKVNYQSFSVSEPFSKSRFVLKHSTRVKNDDEISNDITVIFGQNRENPFVMQSPIIRSAMSDGALSPEAVRAFSAGAYEGRFTVNTGEGGLTSNHLYTLDPDKDNTEYLEIVKGTPFAESVFKMVEFAFNKSYAIKIYRKILLTSKVKNTYIYGTKSHVLFRVNWDAPLCVFPKSIPKTIPDMIFQMSSGLYGVRDKDGNFDEDRYAKVMKFCKMTEIKIAQGAKQTGGKLGASKVSADIAYYRGVEEGKDLFSPNRFPYADLPGQLSDFIGRLQEISKKPVGLKIVVSDAKTVDTIVSAAAKRKEMGLSIPDFVSVDSGEGGSATAPLELMESVGLTTLNSLYIVDFMLRKYNLRDDIKIIISGKILTPDDVAIALSMGSNAVGIARGFMMSGGCIRARMCSGFGSHQCPVGMATQDPKKRASYLIKRKSHEIANYHNNLIKGLKTILAVMGLEDIKGFDQSKLTYKNQNGEVFFDVTKYFKDKFHF